MAGHLIRRLHQQSTQVFQMQMQAAGSDLTSVQFAALDAIEQEPDLDQASLAATIGFDRATIGGVVHRLERKGLVQRVVSVQDWWARQLRLTPEGEQVLGALRPVVKPCRPISWRRSPPGSTWRSSRRPTRRWDWSDPGWPAARPGVAEV